MTTSLQARYLAQVSFERVNSVQEYQGYNFQTSCLDFFQTLNILKNLDF